MLIIAALMPLREFGEFVFLWALATTLATVVALGGPSYHLREGSARLVDPARGLRRLEMLLIAAVIPALLLIAGAFIGISVPLSVLDGLEIDQIDAAVIALVCAAAWVLNLLQHAIVPYRLAERITLSMLVKDAGPQAILMVMAGLLFLLGQLSPTNLLGSFVGACLGLVSLLLAGYLLKPRVVPLLWRDPAAPRPRGMLNFWGSAVLGSFASQIDILLGGLVLNSADLGRYQILKRLANLISLPQIVANWVVAVRLGQAAATSDHPALQALCREGARMTLWPALVLAAGLALSMPLFILLYDLPQGLELWGPFVLLSAGAFVNVVGGVNFMVAAQARKEGFALIARLISVGVLAGIVLSLGDTLLPWSLAMAILLSVVLSNIVMWGVLRRSLRIDTSVFCLLQR